MVILSSIAVWLVPAEYSRFAYAMAAVTLSNSLLLVFDAFLFDQYETFERIAESPVAIAVYVLSQAIIIGAAFTG